MSRHVSLGAEVKGIMAQSYNHGHRGCVASRGHAMQRHGVRAQGGSLKMQRDLPAEAAIPGPWREVVNGTRGSVRKQSGAPCPRHGCMHEQASVNAKIVARGRGRDMQGRARATNGVHIVCHARSGRSVDTREIHVAMVSTPLQQTGADQNFLEVVGHARIVPDRGLDGLLGQARPGLLLGPCT
ncbi:hypothetical protein SLEP1_g22795 [Rubroshorea leprosula]|uniref:Uncharacterized protein n=1 Tax=Rubroshorea leprosula TaxID=152421 RepID=A0AAV5JDA7_9ROSI|nr:hypothetical protein SLEP1_g22795 [Rubroshorea leprosula]